MIIDAILAYYRQGDESTNYMAKHFCHTCAIKEIVNNNATDIEQRIVNTNSSNEDWRRPNCTICSKNLPYDKNLI